MLKIVEFGNRMTHDQPNTILHLNNSLSLPSTAHVYSFAVEYIKQWFLDKFPDNYFKGVNINEAHLLNSFKNFTIENAIKISTPALFITPQVEFDWDRDRVDMYQSGLSLYTRRNNINRAFFKDYETNSFLGIALDELKMIFNFKIKVKTRAQQIDLYKYMNMAFRIGSTQGEYITMDMHIPDNIICQLAKDIGFELNEENNKVKNISSFMKYLNQHSIIPIIFKYRKMTGNYEFFLRMSKLYAHISCVDQLNTDDGENEGMTFTDFTVEFNCELKIPSPKMYMYYSIEEHDIMESLISNSETDSSLQLGMYNIRRQPIDDYNEKHWNLYLKTEYVEDEVDIPLEINLLELFDEELLNAIAYQTKMYLTSDMFIEFKLFNDGVKLPYTVDWNNFILKSDQNITNPMTSIGIYIDLVYLKETIEKMNIEEN